MPGGRCELCHIHKGWLSGPICYDCLCQLHNNVRKTIRTGTVEEVLKVMDDPRLLHSESFSYPLDWACVYGNLPVVQEFLKDPKMKLHCPRETLVECIKKGYTEVVSTILLHQEKEVCKDCVHIVCKEYRRLLTLASLCGNRVISNLLVKTYGIDEKFRVHPPLHDGREASGVLICNHCCQPTDLFLQEQVPICSDCLSRSAEYCMYCHNRSCTGMDLCSLHKEGQTVRWDSETQTFDGKDGRCYLSDCKGKGCWTLSGDNPLYFRLMCDSCHQSKRYCHGCHMKHMVVGREHTCEVTFDLIDGYFYKVDTKFEEQV